MIWPQNHKVALPASFNTFATEYNFWQAHRPTKTESAGLEKLAEGANRVLDLGCADGQLALKLAHTARHVVGVDNAADMLSAARQRARHGGYKNVYFSLGDIAKLNFQAESFDLIISNFSLHHTDLEQTVPRLARLLQPGGWLFLHEPVCPVQNPWAQRGWYHQRGLQEAVDIAYDHGWSVAWRVTRFLQSRAWIEHQLHDALWTPAVAHARYRAMLPGAQTQDSMGNAAIKVLWQRPVESAAVPAPSSVAPSSPAPRAATPIQVERRYPLPIPDAYVPFPRSALNHSVVARFEEQVMAHEARIALQREQETLTYGALNAAANRIAHALLQTSGDSTAPVALLMDQDAPVISAILGTLKAGKTYVVIDPADPPERRDRILAQVGSHVALTTEAEAPHLSQRPHAPQHMYSVEELATHRDPGNAGLKVGPEDRAAIFFTSGSTGEPKGMVRDHRQFLHSTWLNTNTYFVSHQDRQSLLYFPGFTASVPNIYDTLLNGATLCPLNPRHMAPSALIAWLGRHGITHFNPPVGLFRSLLNAATPEMHWPHLRLITLAGQPIYGKDVRDFQAHFGAGAALLYVLAMTEAGAITQAYFRHDSCVADGLVPVGYAVADKDLAIVDEEGKPVAPGQVGQIAVTSEYLSLGYWRNGVLTEQSEQPLSDRPQSHQQQSGDKVSVTVGEGRRRTFLTSDRGRLRADGCLECYGRSDSVVKIRGYRVELRAIEAVLASLPGVQVAIVTTGSTAGSTAGSAAGETTQTLSQAELRLIGYVQPGGTQPPQSAQLRPAQLRTEMSKHLPTYMVPDLFILVEHFPLLPSGKVDRRALPLPGPGRPDLSTPYVAPTTALEEQLACLWADLLGAGNTGVGKVGIEDNFFELGGDSLLAMRLTMQVAADHGYQVPVHFFSEPTIAKLAALISGADALQGFSEGATAFKPMAHSTGIGGGSGGGDAVFHRNFVKRQLLHKGPLWHQHTVPYGVGVQMQRQFIKLPAAQSRLWQRCQALRDWLAWMGHTDDSGHAHELSMLTNTWHSWREKSLPQPDVFAQWVTVQGDEILSSVLASQRPLILCGVHAAIRAAVVNAAVRAHTARPIWFLGGHNRGPVEAVAKVAKARQSLLQGNIVMLMGDGAQGNQGIEIPLGGRTWLFRSGAAELALTTNAILLPVFHTMDASGRVTVEFLEPLTSSAQTEDRQIEDLTRQYAALLNARWGSLLSNMAWGKLAQMFAYQDATREDKEVLGNFVG